MADLIAIHLHHDDLSITCRTLCEKHYNSLVMDADFYWDMCESHTPDPSCADCDDGYVGECFRCHLPVYDSTPLVQTTEWVAHMECAMFYVSLG